MNPTQKTLIYSRKCDMISKVLVELAMLYRDLGKSIKQHGLT